MNLVQVNLFQKHLNIVHGITIKTTSTEHGQNMGRTCSALVVFMVIPHEQFVVILWVN